MKSNILILLTVIFISACDKKCQSPQQEPYKSITDTEWRMVETTSPNLNQNLSLTTFLIFRFGQAYSLDVFSIVNNVRNQEPDGSFMYDIDPENGIILTKDKKTGDTKEFQYDLGKELELVESNGIFYRLVPFKGIVKPDEQCTF